MEPPSGILPQLRALALLLVQEASCQNLGRAEDLGIDLEGIKVR
jgi:hypothetical protein